MKVTFLGTGTSTGVPVPTCRCEICRSDDPRDRRLRPSVQLEWAGASVLIDTATDLRQQVLTHDIQRVDAVLYTHAHADHVLGLDDLRWFNWRQGGPIPVHGNASTLDALARMFAYVFEPQPGESTRPEVQPHPVHGPFHLLGKRILPVPVFHGSMPILGYRLDGFAYLTDVSRVPPASLELLRGLDVLVLNALRERPHPTHLDLAGAIRLARQIAAPRTLLTHMSHEIRHSAVAARLPGGIELAHDGLALEVGPGTAHPAEETLS